MSKHEKHQGADGANEIRVTDRRRINLDEEQTTPSGSETEISNLKPTYVEELEARTRAAEKQVQEVQARFEQLRQQLQRDTDETRQRLNRSADERATGEKAKFIASLLPVLDDLNRAIQAASDGAPSEALLQGIRSSAASFENALSGAGVESIESIGTPFDPELHEAVDTEEVQPEMDGNVTVEYSRGYKIGNRLLRPARVKVGRAHHARKATHEKP